MADGLPIAGPDTRPLVAAPHPVSAAIQGAIVRLLALRPKRVVGEPDPGDAAGLIDDLMAIAAIIDPVIESIGEYARSTVGLSRSDVADCFRHVLRNALEGNATFVIADALRRRGGTEHAAEMAREFRRA